MSISINCKICGKEFEVSPSRYRVEGNCCSKECMGISYRDDNNVSCYVCGKGFHVKPYLIKRLKDPKNICCSKECSSEQRKESCLGEKNNQSGLKGELNSSFKSDIIFTNHGYVKVRSLNHPFRDVDDCVLIHRLIYEEYLNDIKDFDHLVLDDKSGRYFLSKDVSIHHKDHNKLNNSIENLGLMDIGSHISLHNLLNPIGRDEDTGMFVSKGVISSGALYKKHNLDAGLDVSSSEDTVVPSRGSSVISTGLKINVPDGFVGLLWSRSGLSVKSKIEVGAGCIDSGYTGEVKVHLYNNSDIDFTVSVGDRIAQLLTIPVNLNLYEKIEGLTDTDRGAGGFGHTGR